MKLYKIIFITIMIFWPISLFLNNSLDNFLIYITPALLIYLSFSLYKKKNANYQLPFIFIPLISPKLSLLPILLYSLELIQKKKKILNLLLILLSFMILFVNWKQYIGQTIFYRDYEAQQEVIRNTHLYPSVFIARLFHNKVRIIADKFLANIFSLIDPNNYFFSFAPRQVSGNQNLVKFPFLSIFFAILSFINIGKYIHRSYLQNIFISTLITLSVLTVFDGNDFVLWLPICIFISYGAALVKKYKITSYAYYIYLLFSVAQLIQIFISK